MDIRILFKVFIALLFLNTQMASAQTLHTCASDHINDTLAAKDPIFYMGLMQFEEAVNMQHNISEEERSNELYTLPVAVHIIHKGEPYGSGTNITDEQIFSAITALNNDFRHVQGTNGYGNGPDIGIEFCLAVRDPDGQPTNGINRVNGTVVPDYEELGIAGSGTVGASETAVKALSTWPRASYVNIWVVSEIEGNNGGSGVQGYAYFPVNNPVDGIVILYNAFGTVGNLKTYTNLNRTLTHEMGHYLNLYHTFYNTSSCGTEGNCNTAGDKVCDTPVTIQSGSCSTPACGGTQQVQNYMDYTGQTCQNMFSEGQKLRMRTALETMRTSMLSSMGCVAVNDRDAGITAILSPSGYICSGGIQPTVTLSNFGSEALTSVTINYNLNGVGQNTQTWTGNLASGASVTITLNTITPGIGEQMLYAWTSNPNGQSDENTSNDMSTGTFNVATGASATLIVRLDYFGSETTWRITDAANNMLINGGPYEDYAQGTVHTHNICLPADCYTLTFYDSHNDGQGFTNGNFRLLNAEGDTLVFQSGNWGTSSANPFCLEASILPPVASISIADNTICRNTSTSFASTGTGQPTSYSWTFEGGSPSSSTAQNPQNISYANAGTYDVTLTVTNDNGTDTYTCTDCVTVYALPTVTLAGTNPACNNAATGTVTSTVGGGASPYTYSWSTGASTANLNNVAAGTYTLTVTNANSCSAQASATLANPSAITITGTVTNASCSGGGGSITVAATGGTGAKTFSWSTGATGNTISNLSSGSYTVTAMDANGCVATQVFTVSNPSSMVVNAVSSNPTCAGGSNGVVSVNISGGSGTITYLWSNGATGNTISGIGAGTYTVTATDGAGCSISQTFNIVSPAAVQPNLSALNITCNGTTGSAQVNPSGGTAPYQVIWSNGATETSISNLEAGSYNVIVMDAFNCNAQQDFTINETDGLAVTITAQNISCNGSNDGAISVLAQGGTGNYTYIWSTGDVGTFITGLPAGTYGVMIADGEGCQGAAQATITQPQPLVVTSDILDVSCFGGNNGAIYAFAAGGTAPYDFDWSNDLAGNTIDNLFADDYSLIVTDANGCMDVTTHTVSQPDILLANIIIISGESCAGNDGAAQVIPSGGSGSYNIYWNNGHNGNVLEDVSAGAYSVTIIDMSGCSIFADVEIPYECGAGVPSTQLTDEYCGEEDLPINSLIYCEEVAGASMYQWRFTNEQGIIISDEYSLGNVFYVSQIPSANFGMKYHVGVKALVNGIWGPFGILCSIGIEGEQVVIIPRLDDASCGVQVTSWGQVLTAVEVPNVLTYQWHITGANYDWTTYTTTNTLAVEEAMQLTAGEVYSVRMRCSLGQGQFTDWGQSCTFSVNIAINVANYPPIVGILHFYPNPCDGQKIIFDFGNLPQGSTVEDLAIYNTLGKMVEGVSGDINKGTSNIYEYNFNSTLASGMYIIRYKFNGFESEEKLIVR